MMVTWITWSRIRVPGTARSDAAAGGSELQARGRADRGARGHGRHPRRGAEPADEDPGRSGARAVDRADHGPFCAVPRRSGRAEQRARPRHGPRQGGAARLARARRLRRRWPGSACSTWTRRPGCWRPLSSRCASTPATRAGRPGSSRWRSTRAPGSCSRPSPVTSSPPIQSTCGAPSCSARKATWPSSPRTRKTPASTSRGDPSLLLVTYPSGGGNREQRHSPAAG